MPSGTASLHRRQHPQRQHDPAAGKLESLGLPGYIKTRREWGISSTFGAFLSDRLGALVLRAACTAAAAAFLLATGTSPAC